MIDFDEMGRSFGLLMGVCLVVIGILAALTSVVFLWRGGRLGATIDGDYLVLRHYFSEQRIPLIRIERVYRSVDAVVIDTQDGTVTIDDCLLGGAKSAESLLREIVASVDELSRVG